jgi:serine protease Do
LRISVFGRGAFLFIFILMIILTSVNCIVQQTKTPVLPTNTESTGGISYQDSVPINPHWNLPDVSPAFQNKSLSIPDIVKKITKSVVAIHTDTTTYDMFLQPVPAQGVGTGTLVDKGGYVLTNNHVVENAKTIKVIRFDGKSYDAIKVARDPWTDLAIIQIPPDEFTLVEFGSSKELLVGEQVVAVGNALALEGGPTVTSGIVSYIGRSIVLGNDIILHNLIQTDAAINPGNSGGPLLNLSGQMVAVNSATAADAQNIGFAIAISPAMPVIEQLVHKGFITRAYLGAQLYTFRNSVAVISVDQSSPAEQAGLKVGDLITKFNSKEVTTAADLQETINSSTIGTNVEIVFNRSGKEMHVLATLTATPSN